jgi:hypothetical protein
MSPARSSRTSRGRRQPLPQRRNRAEILKAAGVGAAIVLATALLIWLLRPGPVGIPATGGVMNRQPRASWLIVGALVAGGFAAWFVLRRGGRRRARTILTISFVVIIGISVVVGIIWPGGLLRHDVAPAAEPPPTTTPATTPTTPPTTKPAAPGATGATGSSGASGSSGATGSTGAPVQSPSGPTPTVPPQANPPR